MDRYKVTLSNFNRVWPAKGFSAWPHCEKVFWELKVKRSGHAEKPFAGHMWSAKGFSAWPLCDLTSFLRIGRKILHVTCDLAKGF